MTLYTSVVLLTIIWLARRKRKLGIRRRVVREKGLLQHLNTGYDYNFTPKENTRKHSIQRFCANIPDVWKVTQFTKLFPWHPFVIHTHSIPRSPTNPCSPRPLTFDWTSALWSFWSSSAADFVSSLRAAMCRAGRRTFPLVSCSNSRDTTALWPC